jgi:hypothetical protein
MSIQFATIVDCGISKVKFTWADPSLKKAYKEEYLRECNEIVIGQIANSSLYDGLTD